MAPCTRPAPPSPERPALRSIVEFDMLVVDDHSLLVPHDIVAVQAVAILVEIIFALCSRKLLGRQDGVADLAGIGRARLIDRGRQYGDGVVRPGTLVVRSEFVGFAVGLAKRLRSLAG